MVLLGVEIRDYIQVLKIITYTTMIFNLPVYLVAVFEFLYSSQIFDLTNKDIYYVWRKFRTELK